MYYPESDVNPPLLLTQDGIVVTPRKGDILRVVENAEYMLSTGLKDKNGRECYEDDIVSVKHADGEVVKCRIYWCKNHGLAMKELDGWDPLTRYGPMRTAPGTEWTYLGNTHEDPELIPKE